MTAPTPFTFDPQFDSGRGFGVYIHWPYCARICPYCDFNVYAAKAREAAPLLAGIAQDLAQWREASGPRTVDSIFLGGGTPSLLQPDEIAGLIAEVDRLWGLKAGAEITLEANPDDRAGYAGFAAAGVNRLSIGLQSLDDAQLKFLGRTHDAATAREAVEAARGQFKSLSLDFIYALPGQTEDQWRAELDGALALGADHYSLYELSIEPGAAFAYQVARGDLKPADAEAAADLYELTQAMMSDAGYPAYEVSNHARGDAHRSVHNTIYWRSGDWVGAGPGAHGRLTAGGQRRAIAALDRPGDYLKRVTAGEAPWADADTLSPLDVARERLAMGLRTIAGMSLGDILDTGHALDETLIARLVSDGLMLRHGQRIALTAQGRLLADRIAAELAP